VRQSRKSMRPGQMFIVRDPSWPTDRRDIMVVLNDKVEVGFWHGGSWCWGHVAPSANFEVIS
jgi:hypothetical protein